MTEIVNENAEVIAQERLRLRKAGRLSYIHWVAVIASVGLTLIAWKITRNQTEIAIEERFQKQSHQAIDLILERMTKYEDALWSGVGAIHSHDSEQIKGKINRNEWHNFSRSLELPKKYPGINGIGVIYNISKENLPDFIKEQQIDRPLFKVYPEHQESEYFPIVFVEPEDINRQAIGLDMAHEFNRLSAAQKARDTGKTQITGPIALVQDNSKTPGFLFFAPFYSKFEPKTYEERRRNFIGLVYAPFIVNKLMEGTLKREKRQVGIKISDGDQVLFDENIIEHQDFDPTPLFSTTKTVSLYGRTWTFDIRSSLAFRKNANYSQSNMILSFGVIIDTLLFLIFFFLSRSNRETLKFADRVTESLQKQSENLENSNISLKAEVRERKIAELQAEQASRAKSEFLTSMSHELRTPLNGIIGFSDLIIEDAKKDNNKVLLDFAERISKSGQYLLVIISDLLDISKLEAGKFDLQYSDFSLESLIIDIENITSSLVLKQNNKFIYEIKEPIEQEADPLRLKQMLINLISNASKFSSNGTILLEISKKNDFNYFTVTDQGIGISKDKIPKIFDRFTQVHDKSQESLSGTGLGLPVTREISRLMGGDCYANPVVIGAQIVIKLPHKRPKKITLQENTENVSEVS